jgi:serine protease AprX
MAKRSDIERNRRTRSQSDPMEKPFTPEALDRTLIAIPLLQKIETDRPSAIQDIIIDLNLEFTGGRSAARRVVEKWIGALLARSPAKKTTADESNREGINQTKSKYSQQYLFGRLRGRNIRRLAKLNLGGETEYRTEVGKDTSSPIYKIWLDHRVSPFTNVSIRTVKADAARTAFGALGKGIVWAVIDTGIDGSHAHFRKHRNLGLGQPLQHRDFTGLDDLGEMGSTETEIAGNEELARRACEDEAGHGTHVAGIIAGELIPDQGQQIVAACSLRNEIGNVETEWLRDIPAISGMAPQCKLLSLKVLDKNGDGLASNLIAALEYIQDLNGNGRRLLVHGVNMSVGYDFEPKWFACGQSPLCVEVDRLVRSGVIVVVAAGNTGYGYNQPEAKGPIAAGLDVTINDPGNAELAITVGSTHRDMPHMYGVSYFSSKGPTGDGRLKPDIVAPGEKIISCKSGQTTWNGETPAENSKSPSARPGALSSEVEARPNIAPAYYKEDSGTSMAAPHVSGVIAAFLSVRREFIGRPEAVKESFLSTATDLKRAVYFQGKGLVDLMRAIQSV